MGFLSPVFTCMCGHNLRSCPYLRKYGLEKITRFPASTATLSQRCDTVENDSCDDVGFRRCDNGTLRRYQDVTTMFLQRCHNI